MWLVESKPIRYKCYNSNNIFFACFFAQKTSYVYFEHYDVIYYPFPVNWILNIWRCGRLTALRKQKGFLKIHFKFAYFSFLLIHLELKWKIHSYIRLITSKTIPDSRPIWAKSISIFRPKWCKNHTLWGSRLHKGVPSSYIFLHNNKQ